MNFMSDNMTYKETIKKDVKIFGRTIPVFVLALVALTGIGSAALLTYYGSIIGSVTVEQAVLVDGKSYSNSGPTDTYSGTNVAGMTLTDGEHDLKNNGGNPATIKFQTNQEPAEYTDANGNRLINGISTTYRGVLDLTTKTVVFGISPWTANTNKKAKIWYNLTGDTFNWGFIDNPANITLGDGAGQYTLIYYKDKSDRFNNPATAIKSSNIAESLPYAGDGNVAEYNYCGGTANSTSTGDNYEHCHGAKLWLVPTADINSGDGTLTWADASNFLFETDLVAYSKNSENKLTLPANGGGVNFEIVNAFNLALTPGIYTITTNILPV